MHGCCRPDGFCGLLETGYFDNEVPLGCVARDSWIENMQFVGHRVVPVRCGV